MEDEVLDAIESSVILSELYTTIGYRALMQLLNDFAGRNVYVPMRFPSENHSLVKSVGLKAAEALSWRYGGDFISVPTTTLIDRAKRNKKILNDRDCGLTVLAIAKKHKLSRRTVHKILENAGLPASANPQRIKRPPQTTRRVEINRQQQAQLELFPKI